MAIQDLIWAGTENSLQAAVDADEAKTTRLSAGFTDQDEDDDEPRLLEVQDGVAVVSIKGSLNNSAGIWNEIFGMTGYPEIRDAMIAAAQDDSVKHILLDIDSGGGAVSGAEDTAKLIRTVNGIKPVTAFTDGTMASAAYWLGSAAGKVYGTKTALVGSIGVISTHMERSEMLKKEGIGATVVRAGKYKALANGVEKLSADGKAQIQQVVDAAYSVFLESVSEMRGKSVQYVDENMAQGREFIGQASVDVGLIDGLSTFDKLLSNIRSSLPSGNGMLQNRGKPGNGFTGASSTTLEGETTMAKKALTEQDIAAMAAGATLNAAEDNKSTNAAEANASTSLDAGSEAGAEGEAAGGEGEAGENVTSANTQNVDGLQASVQLLTSQLAGKESALLEANLKIAKLEEFKAEAQATHGPLLEIAAKSVSNMMVALGGSALSMEGLGAVALLAEHKRVSEQFVAKFPVGGVASVSGNAPTNTTQVDPRHMARVKAVRFSK